MVYNSVRDVRRFPSSWHPVSVSLVPSSVVLPGMVSLSLVLLSVFRSSVRPGGFWVPSWVPGVLVSSSGSGCRGSGPSFPGDSFPPSLVPVFACPVVRFPGCLIASIRAASPSSGQIYVQGAKTRLRAFWRFPWVWSAGPQVRNCSRWKIRRRSAGGPLSLAASGPQVVPW